MVIPKIRRETLAEVIGTTRSQGELPYQGFRRMGFIDYNGGLEVHSPLLNLVPHD